MDRKPTRDPIYWSAMYKVADFAIDKSRGRYVQIYPTLSGGRGFAEEVETRFRERDVRYRLLPFLVDRATKHEIIVPHPESWRRVMQKIPGPAYHFIFDDATDTGLTVLAFYAYLRQLGVSKPDIGIGSFADRSGVPDVCGLSPYVQDTNSVVDRDKIVKDLTKKGQLPQNPVVVTIPSSFIRDPRVREYSTNYLSPDEVVEFKDSQLPEEEIAPYLKELSK